MKKVYYKVKGMFLKLCLVVGVFTVIQHSYNYVQNNVNTVSNQADCVIMVNKSHLRCSFISALKATDKIVNTIKEFKL